MERTLAGKTALVTGGSRGLGQAIAEKLAAEGALVAVNYAENRAAAEATVARIAAAGGQAFAVQARLGGEAEAVKLADADRRPNSPPAPARAASTSWSTISAAATMRRCSRLPSILRPDHGQ